MLAPGPRASLGPAVAIDERPFGRTAGRFHVAGLRPIEPRALAESVTALMPDSRSAASTLRLTICFDNDGKGGKATNGSTLGQPRLAHPVSTVFDILGVLVEDKTFVSFYCEPRVDPQHLRGLFPGLLKLSSLHVSAG
jgi:hypothetical protein